jgi:hypothetical protein
MNKTILLYVGIFISAFIVTSCSNEEKNGEQVQIASSVSKTEKMLRFENALKNWFESKGESNSNVLRQNNVQTNLEIENQATILLQELGVSQSKIEAKKAISNDMLVYFTLEEYSKKLSLMYNQNNKLR